MRAATHVQHLVLPVVLLCVAAAVDMASGHAGAALTCLGRAAAHVAIVGVSGEDWSLLLWCLVADALLLLCRLTPSWSRSVFCEWVSLLIWFVRAQHPNPERGLPPVIQGLVGLHVAVLFGVPIDWATAIAINPIVAATTCACHNNMRQLIRCAAAANGKQLNAWLRLAAAKGHKGVVQYLCELPLDCGVDPGTENTAPRHATYHGHLDVVQYLCQLPMDRGVDPAADNAVAVAAMNGHEDVVLYLCALLHRSPYSRFQLDW